MSWPSPWYVFSLGGPCFTFSSGTTTSQGVSRPTFMNGALTQRKTDNIDVVYLDLARTHFLRARHNSIPEPDRASGRCVVCARGTERDPETQQQTRRTILEPAGRRAGSGRGLVV